MSDIQNTSGGFTDYSAKTLSHRCERLLIELGIPVNVKGYGYLKEAVEAVYNDPSAINNVLKGLYTDIGNRNGTTASCVERSIRTAIGIMWKGSSEYLSEESFEALGIRFRQSPQPRELIAALAEKLRRGIKEPESAARYDK